MKSNFFGKADPSGKGNYRDAAFMRLGRLLLGLVLAIVVLIAVFGSFYTVPAGNVGVVTWFGAINRVSYPGFNWKWPIAEQVQLMNVQTQIDQVDASAASHDLQQATATIAINYHLDPKWAAAVYQSIGVGYKDTILSPMVQNSFKEAASNYTAEQLITEREKVRTDAETDMKTKAAVYHIIVDNFQIVNFKFSDQYEQAIEQKQVAQQGVETKLQLLAQAKVDAQTAVAQAQGIADARVVQAQAEAQANTLLSQSITPQLLQYQYITKLAPNVQTIFVPSGNQFILPLPNTSGSATTPQ